LIASNKKPKQPKRIDVLDGRQVKDPPPGWQVKTHCQADSGQYFLVIKTGGKYFFLFLENQNLIAYL